MRHILFAAVLVAACHGSDPAKGSAGSSASAPATTPSVMPAPAIGSAMAPPAGSGDTAGSAKVAAADDKSPAPAKPPAAKPADPAPAAPTEGHDFTPEGRALFSVGACGDIAPPDGFPAKLVDKHCDVIKKAQTDYLDNWVKPASAFFSDHVPKDVPKKVVYPFAGGDLSTALTVYPDADEITTISLEPAGDPRDLNVLKGKDLERALDKVEFELKFLYRVNFSNTLNMIDAMRAGALPTQLIFGLSAIKIHGYEVLSLRYFKLNEDGTIHYLDDKDLAKAPDPTKGKPEYRNRIFANAEVQFRRPGGRIQTYRHIQWNLDNDHLKKDPRIIKHLESKGPIAGMTKAASYLLSWDSFSTMRDYLIGHVVWMVSDATGIAPKWGKPAGYEYETYGKFIGPHIAAGNGISKDWRTEFDTEPKRDLPFRFGYYDKKNANHLVIIKKKS
ncbi:MAG: hypothetical protein JWO36_5386 [Myxococcales bacterium]|nr:hypothetical protein [Myxococcales bacterium]